MTKEERKMSEKEMDIVYVHENNIRTKIASKGTYKKINKELKKFLEEKYKPMREELEGLDYSGNTKEAFRVASEIINQYIKDSDDFAEKYKIKAQSKFTSSFLEEMSVYFFKKNPKLYNNNLGIYNKKIFAGMAITSDLEVSQVTKDVDFCIGKNTKASIGRNTIDIIVPIVAVEVKTYLDATMFGEASYSSSSIKKVTPNAKTYVLMGWNEASDEKVITAKNERILDEMFVLSNKVDKKAEPKEYIVVDSKVLQAYYEQLISDVSNISREYKIITPGRLIHTEN